MSEQPEITDEMLKAGLFILYQSGLVDGQVEADKLVLAEAYRAMADCWRTQSAA